LISDVIANVNSVSQSVS